MSTNKFVFIRFPSVGSPFIKFMRQKEFPISPEWTLENFSKEIARNTNGVKQHSDFFAPDGRSIATSTKVGDILSLPYFSV
jgi:hypothetical protein